jgi:biofilm PGA synthesis N-glycosyltransferase PgaC
MTLAVLPLAGVWNLVIYRIQSRMMHEQGLKVRRNRHGLAAYLLFYALVMQPVCVWGYWSELLGLAKKWGTK